MAGKPASLGVIHGQCIDETRFPGRVNMQENPVDVLDLPFDPVFNAMGDKIGLAQITGIQDELGLDKLVSP